MISHTIQKYTLPHLLLKDSKNIQASSLPNPQDFKRIINMIKVESNQKITWNLKTHPILKNWLNSCIPTLKINKQKLFQTNSMGELFGMCNKLKLHRIQVFDLADKVLDSQTKAKKINMFQLQKIYQTFVNLKHNKHLDLAERLRKVLVSKITQFQKLNEKKLLYYLTFIQNIILDRHISKEHKSQLIKQMSKSIKNQGQFLKSCKKGIPQTLILSRLYELSKLYNVQLPSQMMQVAQEVNQTIQTILKNERDKNISSHIIQWNDKAYFNSVFQKIFEKKLNAMGYSFQTNIFIKGNEYDVLIKGKNSKKYCPLAETNSSNINTHQTIALQKVKKIATSRNLQTIQDKVEFKQYVVLDLNGPIHYIDSDCDVNNQISRMEQIKFERLALYGIYKYNLVNFEDWEQANKYEKVSQDFVNQKIHNSINLKKPSLTAC